MQTIEVAGKKLVSLSIEQMKNIKDAEQGLKQAQAYLIQDWSKYEPKDFLGFNIGNMMSFLEELVEEEDFVVYPGGVTIWNDEVNREDVKFYEYSLTGEFLNSYNVDND